ncbi:MAG: hypothetical protein Q9166_006103 [cf. Caloplaca sp. 2 TL-2023]
MKLPSLTKSLYSTDPNHENTSGTADTTSSESLGAVMRNFQFPAPPTRTGPRIQPLHKTGAGQLPRNNSWATESQPNYSILQQVYNAGSIEAYVGASGKSDEPTFTDNPKRPRSSLKEHPKLPPSEGNPIAEPKPVTPHNKYATKEAVEASSERPATNDEDMWTDITIDDGLPPGQREKSSDKESKTSERLSSISNDDDAAETTGAEPSSRYARKEGAPRAGFTIFVDEKDRIDHPQPLRAHPSKTPLSGRKPLGAANVNNHHQSPAVRTPWYRQRARNGSAENYRSSIYGRGALARKVQQEVMITVNVELDVLRQEMNERFAHQKGLFEFEIKKSQVWALQVGDENRKLREELSKERKRREGDRIGGRGLC